MDSAAKAANSRDPKSMAPFAVGDAPREFAWVGGKTSTWQGAVLGVPQAGGAGQRDERLFGVFWAWHTCESDGDHVHALVRTAQGWRIGAEIPETDPGPLRVRDHELGVTIRPERAGAAITDVVRIERLPGSKSPPLLRLSPDFPIETLRKDGPNGEPVTFERAGGIVAIDPPPGDKFSLFMRYSGVLKHNGSDYILPDEATINSYWYPTTARLPATASVRITVPAGWIAIGQGDAEGDPTSEPDGERTFAFRNPIPTCFFTVDAGRYAVTEREAGGVTLAIYQMRPDPATAQRCLETLQRAMAFYSGTFGPFPFKRYTLVETLGSFQGALEAYSFATFQAGALPFQIPHELSHTWWGGIVPCAYTRSMWNEAFAEYSDDLFQRSQHPAQGGPAHLPRFGSRLRLNAQPFGAYALANAHDTSDEIQSAVGYGKGNRVLRTLEGEIGQPAMLRAMTRFIADRRAGDAAEWPDFEAAVDRVTGRTYRWFFEEWIERPGLPCAWLSGVSQRGSGQSHVITGDIVQHGSIYRLTMPILLELAGGGRSLTQVVASGARSRIRITASAYPLRITMDPEGIIPLAPPPETPPGIDLTTYEFPPIGSGARFDSGSNRRVASRAGRIGARRDAGRIGARWDAGRIGGRRDAGMNSCANRPSANRPCGRNRLVRSRAPRVTARAGCANPRWDRSAGSSCAIRAGHRLPSCSSLQGQASIAPAFTPAAFMQRLAAAVNSRDVRAFQELSSAKDGADWIAAGTALPVEDPTNSLPWRVLPLDLPGEAPLRLVVVTRYHPCESGGDHVYALLDSPAGPRLGREYAEADPEGLRFESHRAAATLDPAAGTLRVDDVVQATTAGQAGEPLPDGVSLIRIQPGYHVDSMGAGGQPVWFRQAGGIVAIKAPASPAFALHIRYHGRPAQSREDFITPDEAILTGYWLPHVGRLPVTYDLAVTVPLYWKVFTQGVAAGKTTDPKSATSTWRYRNALPVCYPSLDAGPFRVHSQHVAGERFEVCAAYLREGDARLAAISCDTARAALEFYSKHFSPYPFPRFTVVISSRFSMALEGYSMTTIARGYAPGVLPHEISHTWWGGIVPNTYLTDMWNEAFAEYSDGLYVRMTGRTDSMHVSEGNPVQEAGILADTGGISARTAHDALDPAQSLVGYMKGSMILETLEAMLGRDRVLAGMRALIARRTPGMADTWADVEAAFAAADGAEWRGFFDSWLPSASLPTLRLERVTQTPDPATGGATISADVAQDGGFWMAVPVTLTLKGRPEMTQTVMLRSERAPVRFTIPAGVEPAALEIDPKGKDPRAHPPATLSLTLDEVRDIDHRVLVIYGTGGDEEERLSMREAAEEVKTLLPLARIELATDRSMMNRAPDAATLFFIGRPDTNSALAFVAGSLPVRFGSGTPPTVSLGSRTFADPSTWAFATGRLRVGDGSEADVMLFAGLSADSMRRLSEIHTLSGTQCVYIANGSGAILDSAGPRVAAPTRFAFKAARFQTDEKRATERPAQ
jgi:aminopeptidase N